MLLKKSPSIRDGRRHSLEWSIGGEVPLMPVQLRHGDKLCVRSEPSRELVGCRLTIEPAFVWTADPDTIIAAVNRGRQALKAIR